MDHRTLDNFIGCLVGGAIGDALGGAVEFSYSLASIREQFGPNGLTDYAPIYGRRGAITDDTQMTLFTAEGLILACDRGRERGIWEPLPMVHAAYLRWLATQGYTSSHPEFEAHPQTGLAGLTQMNARRAPGNTCLAGLQGPTPGSLQHPLNDRKGSGGVMRVAPVGLALVRPFELGCQTAALTHGHPSGYLAAGAFAVVIAETMAGTELVDAVAVAADELGRWPGHWETLAALAGAVRAAADGEATPERLEELGQGWVAEEALAIGVYCALVARDFEHGVLLSVNHGGDSDTTGTLTGQLLGVRWGRQALPERWVADLELGEQITRLAEDLFGRYQKAR